METLKEIFKRPLAYVAHPLREDTPEAMAANRASARRYVATLAKLGFAPVATWISMSEEWGEEERDFALEVDVATVVRCDVLILTGKRVSPGMCVELEAAKSLDMPVLNLVGLADFQAEFLAAHWLANWESAPVYEASKDFEVKAERENRVAEMRAWGEAKLAGAQHEIVHLRDQLRKVTAELDGERERATKMEAELADRRAHDEDVRTCLEYCDEDDPTPGGIGGLARKLLKRFSGRTA